MELKIKFEEMRMLLDTENPEFPKYATQILNLANQNSQATRPKIVGQMSELIKEFTGKTIKEWEEWYLKRYPDSIDKATKKILEMVNNFRDVMSQIDESMIRQWVRDLIIIKTFIGLKFQEAFLKKIAKKFDVDYRLSTPNDESKGIDGYIDNIPVSLKPITYESKKMLSEDLKGYIVYYEKQKDGLKIIIPDELENQLSHKK
jgi:hypothetical protein